MNIAYKYDFKLMTRFRGFTCSFVLQDLGQMLQGLIDMQPMEVQDVVGQQRWVDPLKNLNCCSVIGVVHPLAVQVSLWKRWYKIDLLWAEKSLLKKSCTFGTFKNYLQSASQVKILQ